MKETNKSRNKSKMAAVIAVLLVCVLAVGGTIAYLTTHSKLTNSFTVRKHITQAVCSNMMQV